MTENCDSIIESFLKSSNGEFVIYYNYDKNNLNNVTGLYKDIKCNMNSKNFDYLKNNVCKFSSKIYYNEYYLKCDRFNCVSLIHLTNTNN